MKPQRNIQHPNCWGLSIGSESELLVHDYRVTDIAEEYGTPLHVVNQPRLIETAKRFIGTYLQIYPGKSTVYYAFKCNSVSAIVQNIKKGGLKAEVMTEFELALAISLGFSGQDIIVNGPCKTTDFLRNCLNHRVRFIVVDSIEELHHLHQLCAEREQTMNILLRINPNYTPKDLNSGSATGNRKSCAFGLDLKSGEAMQALSCLKNLKHLKFLGFHFHVGTGIRDPKAHANVIRKLFPLFRYTQSLGFPIKICDVGGGYASFTTRGFSATELLLQQTSKYFPRKITWSNNVSIKDFAHQISDALLDYFDHDDLPELILEPGRSIASPNQFLLLKVHRVKMRQGVGRWIITDGGIGTITLPTYYEFHEIFLSNHLSRPVNGKATIIGPCCFAADIVYKNKPMPDVKSGEVLAIMDTGAYFTSLESNFGFPRPAIVSVSENGHEIIRQRENFEQMISRDHIKKEGERNEVFCY